MGFGKSSLRFDLSEQTGLPHVMWDVSRLQDGDITIPKFEQVEGRSVVRDVPHERSGLHLSRPIVLVLDEILKADLRIQVQLAELLLERRISSYELHEDSILVATSNLEEEGFRDKSFGFVMDRLVCLKMDKPTNKEWVEGFAVPRGLHPTIIETAMRFPAFFDGPDSESPYVYRPGVKKCVTGRSLEQASRLLYKIEHLDKETVLEVLSGSVGKAAATEIVVTLDLYKALPSCDDIVSGKAKKLPKGAQYLIATYLANESVSRKDEQFVKASLDFLKKSGEDEARAIFIHAIVRRPEMMGFVVKPFFRDHALDVGYMIAPSEDK
jgi:hypothetical protein